MPLRRLQLTPTPRNWPKKLSTQLRRHRKPPLRPRNLPTTPLRRARRSTKRLPSMPPTLLLTVTTLVTKPEAHSRPQRKTQTSSTRTARRNLLHTHHGEWDDVAVRCG